MNLTISLAQIQILASSPAANFEQAAGQVSEASRAGSQVLLLPELWTSGYDLDNAGRLAQENRRILPKLAALAGAHHIAIGGSMLLEKNGQVYNSFCFFTPGRADPLVYDKIHLFRLMDEDRWLSPGDHLQMIEEGWGPAGMAVCYDLRFPELFRKYALAGARIIFIAAEWPARRTNHWQVLLRARAIENQCFIAAVNSVGETCGTVFGGCSAIINPWGDVMAEGSATSPGLITAALDLRQVETVRQTIPVFQDRRPDLYEK